jgi:hypothetical protein
MYDPSWSESDSSSDESYSEDESYSVSSGSDDIHYRIDSVVASVLQKFLKRAEFGKAKYGTDLDRDDLSVLEWINHAQEEHMDAILYLEKLRQLEEKRFSETSSHTDTWQLVGQFVAVFAAVLFYNCVIAEFWNSQPVFYI